MQVHFYDDPQERPRPRDDVRFNRLGLFVHPDGRRVAVGFDITPFLERPSIQVTITNEKGQEAAGLTVIAALEPRFSLTMHLRDGEPTDHYAVEALLYYRSPGSERMVVDRMSRELDMTQEGEQ